MKKGNVITISDVAEALGVSKTTVSRAISGKGRIGEATRQKVLAYIEEHDYKPNVIARGLAQSKTFNLCVVMPEDYALVDLPFFQEVITGIQEIAGMNEYDILLCICQENDITGLDDDSIENQWMLFTGNEPVKWKPFEDESWGQVVSRMIDEFETLKTTAEMVISLQALGPIANLIPVVTPKVENV